MPTGGVFGTATSLTYGAGPQLLPNAEPAGAHRQFTYTLNGGSSATVEVEVRCVDDAPTAVSDLKTVDEDAAPTTIKVLANDTDPTGVEADRLGQRSG